MYDPDDQAPGAQVDEDSDTEWEEEFDPASLTPEAHAWLKKQIAAADQKARTGSKANAAKEARQTLAADVMKALGLKSDEPPDPDQLAAQVAEFQDKAWAYAVESQVLRLAPSLGVDAERLLDSVSFGHSLDDLGEMDPRSKEFKEALAERIKAAAEQYPAKAGNGSRSPAPDPTQGARGSTAARPTSL